MKKLNSIWILIFAVLTLWGCRDNSTGPSQVEEASAQKKFVWNAMNYWYYWQSDVPELADNHQHFSDGQAFQDYLKSFSDAENLFNALQYSEDRFSFFIDDYEAYQNEQNGIYAALGLNYGYFYKSSQSNELVGYIRYVIPGTPADDAGLKRLNLFTKVDGTTITENNYLNLLTGNSAHELTIAHLDTTGGTISFPEDSTVSVASEKVVEDPVYKAEVIDTSGINIGYLMYNAFQGNSHHRLNEVFGDFKSKGIDDLVLDLRYNGGGGVLTSQLLSSLISGLGGSDKFSDLTYNDKRSARDHSLYFLDKVPLENENGEFDTSNGEYVNTEPINNLSLDKLYVLTSSGTASASEVLINSLKPYIDVEVIGYKTVGKDVGSLTLYDAPAPYLDDSEANPDHKNAIQPIVVKIVNSNGDDYPDGFKPDGYTNDGCQDSNTDNCVIEVTVDNLLKRPAIGDPEEPLLARAIALITGQTTKIKSQTTPIVLKEATLKRGIQDLRPHGNGMYIEPFMLPDSDN
ncbi:MAG: S41 family peptidase [Balneolaceae bacterium]|jgi:C-terminal processing protease CtpA/Prc